MSSSNLINLITLIWNLPLNFDVAFCNWLDKFLPPTILLRGEKKGQSIENGEKKKGDKEIFNKERDIEDAIN